MIRAIDTHAHLCFNQYDLDRDQLIARLASHGIGVINIASSLESIESSLALAKNNRLIWSTIGVHPSYLTSEVALRLPELLDDWSRLRKEHKIVALGEIGLDYANEDDRQSVNLQKAALRQFFSFSKQESLPIVFHCRDAYGDLLTLIKEYQPGISGVVHCFSGSESELREFLDLGIYISFTGMITYPKNDRLRSLVALVPEDRLLLETDSPFLPIQEKRGTRNDPLAILEIARLIAMLRHKSVDHVLNFTLENSKRLFKLKIDELD